METWQSISRMTLLAAGVVLAAGIAAVGASAAAAATLDPPAGIVPAPTAILPTPIATLPTPSATVPAQPVKVVVGTVTGVLTTARHPASGSAGSGSGGSATSSGGSSIGGQPNTAASHRTPAGASGTRSTSRAMTSRGASNSPAGVQASTPVATACLIPSGTLSPALAVDLAALRADLSSPFVRQFPQAFTPCPAGTVPPGPATFVAVDAAVQNLVGACVRLTRAGPPGQTTIVVLDQNLIDQLLAVGLPLDRVVVPCPAASGGGESVGASPAGDPHTDTVSGAQSLTALTLARRLAFTGATIAPLLAAALALLCLGLVLVRKAQLQLLAVRDRPRRCVTD